ncbi:MAG: hypothetical protein ACI86C_001264 [Candidatus Latescibacterota bacterium]|jgi:hypothetical protein
MSLKSLLVVTVATIFFQQSFAQRNYDEYNIIGFHAGLSFTDIATSNFTTKQGSGFMGGFTTRGSFRGAFDLLYGLNFVSATIGVLAQNGGQDVFVDYAVQGAQIMLLGSLNIVKHHLSLEFGPALNISGKLKLNSESQEAYLLDGYNELQAGDINDINTINFHFAGGVTAGIESFRVYGHYQYGVTNMLGRLNDDGLEVDNLEGHMSMLTVGAVFYF